MSQQINGFARCQVIAVVNDLFLRSKITAVAQAAGVEVEMLNDMSRLRARFPAERALLLIDLGGLPLNMISALSEFAEAGHRVIGFLSHVEVERAKKARATGCEVMARSQFFEKLPNILTGQAEAGATTSH